MQQRRLAIFGTFDVENYGDLLFPLIARNRLAEVGIQVTPVSPTSVITKYRDAIHAMSQEEFSRDPQQFDGVLIGGGNIVHLMDFRLPGYSSIAYPALWISATAQAARHGLPVFWNAPGVLAPQQRHPAPEWLRNVVGAADYFSVRDAESADAMELWSGRRPDVVPDSAFDLPRVWSAEILQDRFNVIRSALGVPSDMRVVAVHLKERSLGGMSIADFATNLGGCLEKMNACAVLISLGGCHGDDDMAQAVHAMLPARSFSFHRADLLQDIASVIACSNAYIGASLHGYITATAYGSPARVVGVPALHKFSGQAAQVGRTEDVVSSWNEALGALEDLASQARRPLPVATGAHLDKHWSSIVTGLKNPDRQMQERSVFSETDLDTALAEAVLKARSSEVTMTGPVLKMQSSSGEQLRPPHAGDAGTVWDSVTINRNIVGKNYDAARDAISETLTKTPDHLPARLAQVRLAVATGDLPGAAALVDRLYGEVPDNHWVWLARLDVLAKTGQHEAAVQLFGDRLNEMGVAEATLSRSVGDLLASLPLNQQVAILQRAVKHLPDNTSLQIRLAMRAHAIGYRALAIDMFRRAENKGVLPPYAVRARNQLLVFEGPVESAVERLVSEVEKGASDVETLCRLSRFAASAGQFDLAAKSLRKSLDLHPLEWRSIFRLNRTFLTREEDRDIFRQLEKLRRSNSPHASWLFQFSIFALRAGEDEIGLETVRSLSATESVGPTARQMLAALSVLAPAAPRDPVIADSHVRVVRKPSSRATIVVFGGLLGGLSYINDRYLDTLLATFQTNVIYLRDPHGRAFLKGVPGFGRDEGEMHDWLSGVLAELGSEAVVTVGGSASGYAAVRAGLAIGAGTVISLAGFVAPERAEPGEHAQVSQALLELFGSECEGVDLRPALQSRPDMRLVHVVGGSYAPDVSRARRLEGLPNARIVVLDDVNTHHVALPAVVDGTLKRELEKAIAVA